MKVQAVVPGQVARLKAVAVQVSQAHLALIVAHLARAPVLQALIVLQALNRVQVHRDRLALIPQAALGNNVARPALIQVHRVQIHQVHLIPVVLIQVLVVQVLVRVRNQALAHLVLVRALNLARLILVRVRVLALLHRAHNRRVRLSQVVVLILARLVLCQAVLARQRLEL